MLCNITWHIMYIWLHIYIRRAFCELSKMYIYLKCKLDCDLHSSIVHIRQSLLTDRPVLGRRSSGSGHQRWVARFTQQVVRILFLYADFHVIFIILFPIHMFRSTETLSAGLQQRMAQGHAALIKFDWYPESFAVFVNLHTFCTQPTN